MLMVQHDFQGIDNKDGSLPLTTLKSVPLSWKRSRAILPNVGVKSFVNPEQVRVHEVSNNVNKSHFGSNAALFSLNRIFTHNFNSAWKKNDADSNTKASSNNTNRCWWCKRKRLNPSVRRKRWSCCWKRSLPPPDQQRALFAEQPVERQREAAV